MDVLKRNLLILKANDNHEDDLSEFAGWLGARKDVIHFGCMRKRDDEFTHQSFW
jgi:hypothetical protein